MQESNTLTPSRDNLFGVCHTLSEDFGINPLYLRVAFGIALLWNPAAVVAIYSALGGLVALAHWLYPNVRSHSASKTKGKAVSIRSTYGHAEAANEVGELLKAA